MLIFKNNKMNKMNNSVLSPTGRSKLQHLSLQNYFQLF